MVSGGLHDLVTGQSVDDVVSSPSTPTWDAVRAVPACAADLSRQRLVSRSADLVVKSKVDENVAEWQEEPAATGWARFTVGG
jgi:hypothetical protein